MLIAKTQNEFGVNGIMAETFSVSRILICLPIKTQKTIIILIVASRLSTLH